MVLNERAKALRPFIQATLDEGGADAICAALREPGVLCDQQLHLHGPQTRDEPAGNPQSRLRWESRQRFFLNSYEKLLIATCRRGSIARDKVSYHRAVQISNGIANPSPCPGSNTIANPPKIIENVTRILIYE